MSTKHLFTLSFVSASRMKQVIKSLLITLLLAGITMACVPEPQVSLNAAINSDVASKPSDPKPVAESVDQLLKVSGQGHDFGAINYSGDPYISRVISRLPFIYKVNGQTVVRRSELGPLTGDLDKFLPDKAAGQQLSTITQPSSGSASLCVDQPLITYTYAGLKIVRRSELGPLTESNCISLQADVPRQFSLHK